MMPSRSTPNLQQPVRDPPCSNANAKSSVYSYLQSQSGLNFSTCPTTVPRDESPPPAPPVRDSSTLKSVKYGPGHEKFPSWPVPAAAETPHRSPPTGGSHRSKSWTDHTNYPKEKVITYTRPYMKRQHSQYTQQKLKTVMEKCEKIPPETFEARFDKMNNGRLYLPNVDHDGKHLGDMNYMVPSPPERDIASKPQLTQADLEEYARLSYQSPLKFSYTEKTSSHQHLMQSTGFEEFMEYTKNYEESLFSSMNSKSDDSMMTHMHHQKQLSYAQSEGYHSYVSSTDSTSTPFLDRLRRDSEAVVRSPVSSNWDDQEQSLRHEGRDSVVTTSSGSASSSETLKWLGSISDVSVASSSCTHQANSSSSNSTSSRQLIAHSARVQTPQRHHSESVLYMARDSQEWKDKECRNNNANKLKLFPVNTYTVQDNEQISNNPCNRNSLQSALSVADRISELERQQRFSYLDPDKKHKVSDPTLKAIQKKALLSFYERHHSNKTNWRSEPQLSQQALSIPQPPPRIKVQLPSRRASSASDYAAGTNSRRSSLASRESKTTESINKTVPRHQHSNSCGSLPTDMLGPMIVGPSISVDDWVPDRPPERPPKNPNLRCVFPDLFQDNRMTSPDLPPPSPPTVLEDEVINSDEPLPPPPPECEPSWEETRLKQTGNKQYPAPQVRKSPKSHENEKKRESPIKQTVGLPENIRFSSVRSSIKTRPTEQIFHQVSSKPYNIFGLPDKIKTDVKKDQILGFPSQKGYAERSSTKYPTTQKVVVNGGGTVAVSQKVISTQFRAEPLKPITKNVPNSSMLEVKRSSLVENIENPPPLQPRQLRINQSMRGRISDGNKQMRASPPRDDFRLKEAKPQPTSQSKASYLASRRDRDRIVPDSDTGSYKRTMSPNGHAIAPEVIASETPKINARETIWPLNRPSKTAIKNNNNNTNLIRLSSMNEKPNKLQSKCDEKEEIKRHQPSMVLPDVLPTNVKILNNRCQFNRPSQLSISNEIESEKIHKPHVKSPMKTPPVSPPKSPPRGSPFAPLRATNLSNTPTNISSSPIDIKPQSPTLVTARCITNFPSMKTFTHSATSISPPSPKRVSPQIKPSLSPSLPTKLSPLRMSPMSPMSTNAVSPLISPTTSPKASTPELPLPPVTSKKLEECPQVIEGLQMIQRTEIVLRVNTTTTDASSQTEKDELPPTPLPTRKKLQEEIECEKLSEDFVNHLPTSDRLKELLVPGPEYKKSTDYVQGLFKVEVTSRPRSANSPFRSKNNSPSNLSPIPNGQNLSMPTTTSTPMSNKQRTPPSSQATSPMEPMSPLSGNSTYFTTSEPKAKFLTMFSQDMNKCSIAKDTKDLYQKKIELVSRLGKKLEVLRSEQLVVSDESRLNEELGEHVGCHINQFARPHEAAKFRLHIEEVGKITSLLLGLSGRLARAENALTGMAEDHPERIILETKRDKLLEQLEEAKGLKESIDRRSISVSNILCKYLDLEEYADYDHFINMKAKLIMDSKEIADKIKLGEEQLLALQETLIETD